MITMVRQVENDFQALLMCQAMEACGGQPFSVVYVPAHRMAHVPHSDMVAKWHFDIEAKWHVFGQVPDKESMDIVDEAYEKLRTPGTKR